METEQLLRDAGGREEEHCEPRSGLSPLLPQQESCRAEVSYSSEEDLGLLDIQDSDL